MGLQLRDDLTRMPISDKTAVFEPESSKSVNARPHCFFGAIHGSERAAGINWNLKPITHRQQLGVGANGSLVCGVLQVVLLDVVPPAS
jgi:hypothetical protein